MEQLENEQQFEELKKNKLCFYLLQTGVPTVK